MRTADNVASDKGGITQKAKARLSIRREQQHLLPEVFSPHNIAEFFFFPSNSLSPMDLIYCNTKMSDEFAGILMTRGAFFPPRDWNSRVIFRKASLKVWNMEEPKKVKLNIATFVGGESWDRQQLQWRVGVGGGRHPRHPNLPQNHPSRLRRHECCNRNISTWFKNQI